MFVKLSLVTSLTIPLWFAAMPAHADEVLEPPGGPVYDDADVEVEPSVDRRQLDRRQVGPARRHRSRQLRQAVVEQFDANGDGRLEPRERQRAVRAIRKLQRRMAQRAGRLQQLVRRFDRDGDGHVSPEEMPPAAAHKLRRLDRNGDGWIDRQDFAARRVR